MLCARFRTTTVRWFSRHKGERHQRNSHFKINPVWRIVLVIQDFYAVYITLPRPSFGNGTSISTSRNSHSNTPYGMCTYVYSLFHVDMHHPSINLSSVSRVIVSATPYCTNMTVERGVVCVCVHVMGRMQLTTSRNFMQDGIKSDQSPVVLHYTPLYNSVLDLKWQSS